MCQNLARLFLQKKKFLSVKNWMVLSRLFLFWREKTYEIEFHENFLPLLVNGWLVLSCTSCSYSRGYFIVSIECNNSIAVNVSHNLQGTPFFNGKLILHDPPGMGNGNRGLARPFNPGNVLANTSNNAGGFLMTSPPSKLGAIPKKMPSPAAQVHIQSLFRNWRFILVKMPYPASPI